jgi:hypothetical protein
MILLAEEPLYEEEGPRRAKPTEKAKRLSQSKLDVISENQSSKLHEHVIETPAACLLRCIETART